MERKKDKIYKWHPKLTQEQIEELIAEGIEPGDQEYNMYLWNHGINPFDKIKIENESNKKWHPELTQEQIEELIAEGLEPGDQEYNMYLWNHGINPFEEREENLDSNDKINENEIKKTEERKEKKTKSNLPIRSFWEIYNDTCTEHVGSIANNLYKMAHMKILPQKRRRYCT